MGELNISPPGGTAQEKRVSMVQIYINVLLKNSRFRVFVQNGTFLLQISKSY